MAGGVAGGMEQADRRLAEARVDREIDCTGEQPW
jgi:hypothetical protein